MNIPIHSTRNTNKGFTLLEILLVVAAIAILAGIIIIAINPARQLADTRDAQRRSDVEAIANALAQYYIRNGSYPTSFAIDNGTCEGKSYDTTTYGLCTQGADCGGVNLESTLTPDYIVAIPEDPSAHGDANFSGYSIYMHDSKRITVCALLAENASISITR